MQKYKWDYCDHCEIPITICNSCNNNVCNGGVGRVYNEKYELVNCPDCEEAYQAWQNETNCPEEYKKIFDKMRIKNENSN